MKKLIVSLSLLLFVIAVVWFATRGYGKVSDAAYQLATASYGACLAQDNRRIDAIAVRLDDDQLKSRLSEAELEWLTSILVKARNQDWESATKIARDILEGQVQRN